LSPQAALRRLRAGVASLQSIRVLRSSSTRFFAEGSSGMCTLSRSLIGLVTLAALSATVPPGCSGQGNVAGRKPRGAGQADAQMCSEHGVEKKYCSICHPEIKDDPNILLCKEHGDIPEDICTACHPELKAKYKTCRHELPPAFCQECRKKVDGEGSKAEGRKG
jgi:cobalt-zinc-cadmium efflux system membrane fusion protein